MARNSEKDRGFSVNDSLPITILDTETVSDIVDLGRNYGFITIGCDDMSDVPADTKMTVKISLAETGTMRAVHDTNGGDVLISQNLPTSGTFHSLILGAFGARRVEITLDKAVTGDVEFDIVGMDSGIV